MNLSAAIERNETQHALDIVNSPDFNPTTNEAFAALCTAIKLKQMNVQQALVEKGVGKNRVGENGDRLIHVLARAGSTSIALALKLERDVNVKNDLGETALSLAQEGGHVAIVDYLLVNGAEPQEKTHHFCHIQ